MMISITSSQKDTVVTYDELAGMDKKNIQGQTKEMWFLWYPRTFGVVKERK